MKVSIPYFKGMVPRQSSRLLPDGFAADCTNVNLKSGDITAWNQPSVMTTLTPAGIKTIYKTQTGGVFLRWQDDVNVARGPVAGDTTERLYYTGARDTSSAAAFRPKVTNRAKATGAFIHAGHTAGNYPNDWLILGVPEPSSAPSASAGAPSGDESVTAYVYTWVNELGDESAPSTASNEITFTPGDTVTITNITDPTEPSITDYGLTNTASGQKRLYRAVTGPSGTTEYFFVKAISYGTTSTTDTLLDAALGETLESEGWALPPTDGHSIIALPNGITVIASKNQIFLSEQNRPHAYPAEYALTCDYTIIGLGAIDTTVVILTQANPYIALGTEPAQFSMAKIELPYGCVAKRSIAHLKGYGIIYASPNGLAAINGTGVQLISDPYFTREQWQDLIPESIYGFTHDDRYFFFFDRY